MARFRRTRTDVPGIRRTRRGTGFSYRGPDGTPLSTAERTRAELLAVPPAWREVWICADPAGHIQAVGVDESGRRQYIYHEGWQERMRRRKYDRALDLAETLPSARRRVTTDLRLTGLPRARVLAGAFRLLDTAHLRVGSPRYAARHGSTGLTTLQRAHLTLSGSRIRLSFVGKSAQDWEIEVEDPDLAELLALARRRPGDPLLRWEDEDGTARPLTPEDINEDVRARTGGDFTSKDFRTLHGTAIAAESLARTGPATSIRGRARAVAEAMAEAATALGNTPAVARASYVDPRVIDHYEHGRTVEARSGRAIERELLLLLRG